MSKAWYTISFDSEAGRSLPEFSRERTVSIGKTIQWQGCSWEILDLSKTHVILAQIFEPGTYISFTPQQPKCSKCGSERPDVRLCLSCHTAHEMNLLANRDHKKIECTDGFHQVYSLSFKQSIPEFPTKPVLQPGKLMRTYPAVHACGITLTPRFEVTCDCPTYASNAGVCKTFEAGSNGRCVYCDHTRYCHVMFRLEWLTEPPAEIARKKIYDLWKRLKPDFGQASSQALVRRYIEEATAETPSSHSEPELRVKIKAIVQWLEANQPDVFRRGLWDVINEAALDATKEQP